MRRETSFARCAVVMSRRTKHGGAQGKKGGGKVAKNAKSASFVSDTARKTGRSKRSVEKRGEQSCLILDHAATTATPRAKEVGHDL